MSSGSELSLDFKPFFTPKPVSEFLRDISSIVDCKKRLSKLEYYLNSLEEERTKIVLFKRELPLCLLLLNDAIEDVRSEEIRCRKRVLERKLDEDGEKDLEKDCTDKMNWMSSAQLWIDNYSNSKNDNIYDRDKKNKAMDLMEKEDSDASANEYLFSGSKYRNGEGALVSFKGSSAFPLRKEEESMLPSSVLSLVSTGIKNTNHEPGAFDLNSKNSSKPPSSLAAVIQSNSEQPSARKTRRSWSPELHRRFVNALQQLGGPQVATPKQIREVMKVDGLTNDEVKSHLQKYRLHTRRLPATSAPTIGNQKFVVSRGMWVPHEQYVASKQRNSQSSSPQGPLQLAGSALGISTTISDSAEDDDVESETCSWKEHLQRSSNEETE